MKVYFEVFRAGSLQLNINNDSESTKWNVFEEIKDNAYISTSDIYERRMKWQTTTAFEWKKRTKEN
jgi:hypothetical protein